MFPQSELDNYKLQVELLQEKLQKSEISRQHLEHKLDKILHKRDEHDKIVRSKAKQKYQQFLEEQQRRNERNKQLVQMLEHIEKQTEAMNARSERLKMMKLQYEMYFAKLVHSQTRRCIQSSVPMNVTPTSARPLEQTMMPAPPSVTERYKYTNDMEPQLMTASYQTYSAPIGESEHFLRSQVGNLPSSSNMEIPSLANFKRAERNDYTDLRNLDNYSTMQNTQQYEFQPRIQTNPIARDFVETQSDSSFTKMERDPKLYTSTPIANEYRPLLDTPCSITKDKQYVITDNASSASTTNTPFPNDRMPNNNLVPETTITQSSYTSSVSSINNNVVDKNNMKMFNETKTSNPNHEKNYSTIISPQEVNSDVKSSSSLLPQEFSNDIQKVKAKIENELKSQDKIQPVIEDYIPKTYEMEQLQHVEQKSKALSNASKTAVNTASTNKIEAIDTTTNLPYTDNSTLDSSTTPVSIENIENAIYGELLTPLETIQKEQQINSNLTPNLLENLVTQSDKLEANNIALKEFEREQQEIVSDTTSTNYDNSATGNDYEQQPQSENYDQTTAYDDYNTQQQVDTTVNNASDYAAYDNNVDNSGVEENPQQQQYEDYSNYDPSQYSYPGYIYDETTGEYKPDPNAPAEQYATDQQYAVEGYDQQQYQQQEGYDYNQSYEQDPSLAMTNTTQHQEDITNSAQINNETAQQVQPQQEAEPIEIQPETEPVPVKEELNQTPAKITKPTSILSTADKNEAQKKKKRVNFVDSSETDESMADKGPAPVAKTTVENTMASNESDFDFSSSTEVGAQPT